MIAPIGEVGDVKSDVMLIRQRSTLLLPQKQSHHVIRAEIDIDHLSPATCRPRNLFSATTGMFHLSATSPSTPFVGTGAMMYLVGGSIAGRMRLKT